MKRISLFLALVLVQAVSFCQFKNHKVNTLENQPEEVTIAINPLNPDNLVAGANLNNYYWSTDRGISWGEGTITSRDYGVWGDPVVVFDLNGHAYYFHLSMPSRNQWIDRMVCHKSTDGAKSWSDPGTYTR